MAILFLGVLFQARGCLRAKKHKKFLIEIFPYRSRLIRAWMFMRSAPKAGQEDIPVCYEKWNESEQVNKALEKARKRRTR